MLQTISEIKIQIFVESRKCLELRNALENAI